MPSDAHLRLQRLRQRLERSGHTVRPVDLSRLSDHEAGALAEDADRRLRAIDEGRRAGWVPR